MVDAKDVLSPARPKSRVIKRALRMDSEADLMSILTPKYTEKLKSFQASQRFSLSRRKGSAQAGVVAGSEFDLRDGLDADDPACVVCELSPALQNILGRPDSLSDAVAQLLSEGDILYAGPGITTVRVGIFAVKITPEDRVINEHASLSFLQSSLSDLPIPMTHGVIQMGYYHILFTDFVEGITLEEAWPRLDVDQKRAVQQQLDVVFGRIRSIPRPDGAALGGINGEGCRDIRRDLYMSTKPIMNPEQFEDFIFAGSKHASPCYIRFLRDILRDILRDTRETKCVYTHGDLRPANILVQTGEDGKCCVQAVIDWKSSGFYPDYWEAVKMTNNLTPSETFDWYNYLPDTMSTQSYKVPWLVDRVWDRSMANN